MRCFTFCLCVIFLLDVVCPGWGGWGGGMVTFVVRHSCFPGWGVGGWGDGNVRCYVILLSGMGWVGWGMVTFVVCHLVVLDVLSGMGWSGWGMVTFFVTSSCCP